MPIRPPMAVPAVERIDTHGSMVFMAGDRVYKLKRAVRFPYMDYGTPEKRASACEAEVRLNRRTAPSLYLGVAPVLRGAEGGFALGQVCDTAQGDAAGLGRGDGAGRSGHAVRPDGRTRCPHSRPDAAAGRRHRGVPCLGGALHRPGRAVPRCAGWWTTISPNSASGLTCSSRIGWRCWPTAPDCPRPAFGPAGPAA